MRIRTTYLLDQNYTMILLWVTTGSIVYFQEEEKEARSIKQFLFDADEFIYTHHYHHYHYHFEQPNRTVVECTLFAPYSIADEYRKLMFIIDNIFCMFLVFVTLQRRPSALFVLYGFTPVAI